MINANFIAGLSLSLPSCTKGFGEHICYTGTPLGHQICHIKIHGHVRVRAVPSIIWFILVSMP